MNREVASTGIYWIVFVLLLILLALSLIAGEFELGIGNLVLALGISVAKAVLIAIFFMHLRYASSLVRLTAVASLLWLGLLLSLTLADYTTRGWNEPGSGRLIEEQHPKTYDATDLQNPNPTRKRVGLDFAKPP